VYVVGLYLEKPTNDARAAITTNEAKRIVLVMLRDVSREQFVQAVKEGILRNSGPAMPTLRARLDRLEKALPALKKGNILDFTYLPGIGTLMRGQGRELTIPGKDFADALFSVWPGPKPISEALKRQLLSGPPSAPATPSISHVRMPAPAEPASSGQFIVKEPQILRSSTQDARHHRVTHYPSKLRPQDCSMGGRISERKTNTQMESPLQRRTLLPPWPSMTGVRNGSAKPGANCRKLSTSGWPGKRCGTATDGT
jgi:hypothetical protein